MNERAHINTRDESGVSRPVSPALYAAVDEARIALLEKELLDAKIERAIASIGPIILDFRPGNLDKERAALRRLFEKSERTPCGHDANARCDECDPEGLQYIEATLSKLLDEIRVHARIKDHEFRHRQVDASIASARRHVADITSRRAPHGTEGRDDG